MEPENGRYLDELVCDGGPAGRPLNLAPLRVRVWAVVVLAVVAGLALQTWRPEMPLLTWLRIDLPAWQVLVIFLAAMGCELIDSSLGMGYGTTLTPVLLLAGFEPLQIVPAVLLSECGTGFAAGLLHHRDGNVDFVKDRQALSVLIALLVLTVVGTQLAVYVAGAISKAWLGRSIAGIILAMGIIVLLTGRRTMRLRPASLVLVGGIAAFNKGLSGGGYGPLVTGGQVVSGLRPRQAVAITSLTEGFTCLVALAGYLWAGKVLDWSLAAPLIGGAMLSVPLATLLVRRMPETLMRRAVGIATCALGALALAKALG